MAPCSIRWCGKTSQTSSLQKDGITFHLFPRDPKMKEKWMYITRRDNWYPTKHSVICSRHFTEDCFEMTKHRRRLLDSAIPTLYLPLLSAEEKSDESDESSPSTESTQPEKRKDFPGSPSDYTSPTEKRLCRKVIDLTETVLKKNRQLKNLREKLRYLQKRIDRLENTYGVDKNENPSSLKKVDSVFHSEVSPHSSPLGSTKESDPLDASPRSASRSPIS